VAQALPGNQGGTAELAFVPIGMKAFLFLGKHQKEDEYA
jgi:hypothetical protein